MLFSIPLGFRSLAFIHMKLSKLKAALWAGLLLRLFVAIWNGFFGPSFGAEDDALGFHMTAVEYSNNLVLDQFVIGHIYSYLLGVFYYITTDSLFLGSLLSVAAWFFSALILIWIMRILTFNKSNQWKVMFIYAMLPSSILLTSITLRETFQLLFVNLAIYSVLKIYVHKSSIHWLFLICSIVGMGALHGALLASGVFVLIATLFLLTFRNRKWISLPKLLLALPVVVLLLYYGFLLFSNISYNLHNGLVLAIQAHQEGVIAVEGRALYRSDVAIDSMFDLATSVPVFLFQYLFEPMPWRISSSVDVIALMENFLRAWLLWRVLMYFRKIHGQNRKLIVFVFLSYLVMETIWSMGTSNWGTGLRHHLPSIGLLLVAAFFYKGKKGGLV